MTWLVRPWARFVTKQIDRITIGNGARGEITKKIQKVFFEITKGERPAPGPWLTYVREQKARA